MAAKKLKWGVKYNGEILFKSNDAAECFAFKEKHLGNEFFLTEEVNKWKIVEIKKT